TRSSQWSTHRSLRLILLPSTTLFRSNHFLVQRFSIALNRQCHRRNRFFTGFGARFKTRGRSTRLGLREARTAVANDAREYGGLRSEEHTTELQSREKRVCRLLLEKKN